MYVCNVLFRSVEFKPVVDSNGDPSATKMNRKNSEFNELLNDFQVRSHDVRKKKKKCKNLKNFSLTNTFYVK